MFRLVEADGASAGKFDRGGEAPLGVKHGCAGDAFFLKRAHGQGEVVAHQIENCAEQWMLGVPLHEVAASGMNAYFSGRQLEDEPSAARIDRTKVEDVAKEGAVRFRIFAVEQQVRAVDHRESVALNTEAGNAITGNWTLVGSSGCTGSGHFTMTRM